VPGRGIPVPDTVSPQLQSAIAAPYWVPAWNANPKSAAEWKELVAKLADAGAPARAALREKLANVLVSYNGYLTHSAQLYANGHDLKDPQLSPIYGDFHGFPRPS
jgi:hypothetical protein